MTKIIRRHMLFFFGALALLSFSGAPVGAEAITTTEQVKVYLKEEVFKYYAGIWLDTNSKASTTEVMPTWKCDGKILNRASSSWDVLNKAGIITIKGTKVQGGIDDRCDFVITKFEKNIVENGLAFDEGDGRYWIPLVKQEILGFKDLSMGPGIFRGSNSCLIYATPLIKNVSLSKFAEKYRSVMQKSYPWERIFNPEVEGTFCGIPLEDGNIRWSVFSRF